MWLREIRFGAGWKIPMLVFRRRGFVTVSAQILPGDVAWWNSHGGSVRRPCSVLRKLVPEA